MKLKVQMDFDLDVCRKAQEKGEMTSILLTVIVKYKFLRRFSKAKHRASAYSCFSHC